MIHPTENEKSHVELHAIWLAEWHDRHNEFASVKETVANWQRIRVLEEFIISTPAKSNAGMIAQLEFALSVLSLDNSRNEVEVLLPERAIRAVRAALASSLPYVLRYPDTDFGSGAIAESS